jgi:hypothetical protein
MKAPSGETGDSGLTHRAETVLFVPEKAKKTGASKRIPHMIRFTLFEIGFIGRIVGVRVASNLDMSTYGSVAGRQEPYLEWSSVVIEPAFLRRLRDTHLESANVAFDGLPVDGIPFFRFA